MPDAAWLACDTESMERVPLSPHLIDRAPDWLRTLPLRPDRWRNDQTRAFALVESGDMIAGGMMWTSRVHDGRYWFEIAVDPDRRGRGLGRTMFQHLATERAAALPFIARGFVDEDRVSFVRALGARTIQVVPPAEIHVSARTALRPDARARGADSVPWDDVARANADVYEWTHADWSPVAPGFADALNEGLADDLDREASSVAVVDGRIVANCMVYRDSRPPVVTAEAIAARYPEGEALVEGCVRRSLDHLAERGVRKVEFDGHVSDPHFLPVWTRLSPTGRWFHLLEVDPRAADSGGQRTRDS